MAQLRCLECCARLLRAATRPMMVSWSRGARSGPPGRRYGGGHGGESGRGAAPACSPLDVAARRTSLVDAGVPGGGAGSPARPPGRAGAGGPRPRTRGTTRAVGVPTARPGGPGAAAGAGWRRPGRGPRPGGTRAPGRRHGDRRTRAPRLVPLSRRGRRPGPADPPGGAGGRAPVSPAPARRTMRGPSPGAARALPETRRRRRPGYRCAPAARGGRPRRHGARGRPGPARVGPHPARPLSGRRRPAGPGREHPPVGGGGARSAARRRARGMSERPGALPLRPLHGGRRPGGPGPGAGPAPAGAALAARRADAPPLPQQPGHRPRLSLPPAGRPGRPGRARAGARAGLCAVAGTARSPQLRQQPGQRPLPPLSAARRSGRPGAPHPPAGGSGAADAGGAGPADGPAAENLDEALHARLTERGEATWRALQALLEEIARSDPQYAAVRGFAPPHPPEGIARALPEGGALLLLYPLDDGLACFVLRRTVAGMDLRVARAPLDRATLAGLVAATFPPSAGGLPGAGATLDAALLKLARALYPALAPLLPPFDPERPATLVMAPTGALHRLPLHACPWPDPARRVLDGYVVSYATTADVLLLASRKPATPAGVAALAPGLPSAAGRPPLVGSLVEACVLAQQGGASPLLRRRANLAALLREHGAARKRWVLLATHGRAGGRHAARSGLLFYDEQGQEPVWLSAAEILGRLDLEGAEHLGVTACSTHADDAAPGDRLAGLLRALLYRGARSVQATLWPVRDDAALLVSAWTWEQLLAGGRPGPARSGAPGKRAGWPGVSLRPHARVGAVCAARRPAYHPLIRRRWPVAVVVRGPRAQSRRRFPLTGPPIPETMARRCWRCAMPLRISGCRWDTCKWTVGGIPRGPPPIGA